MVMDIAFSWSVSLNGAKVFANCKFNTKMVDKELPITYQDVFTWPLLNSMLQY